MTNKVKSTDELTRIDRTGTYSQKTQSIQDWFEFVISVNNDFGLYGEDEFYRLATTDNVNEMISTLKHYEKVYNYRFVLKGTWQDI